MTWKSCKWCTQDVADVYAHFFLLCALEREVGWGDQPTEKKGLGSVSTAFCAFF